MPHFIAMVHRKVTAHSFFKLTQIFQINAPSIFYSVLSFCGLSKHFQRRKVSLPTRKTETNWTDETNTTGSDLRVWNSGWWREYWTVLLLPNSTQSVCTLPRRLLCSAQTTVVNWTKLGKLPEQSWRLVFHISRHAQVSESANWIPPLHSLCLFLLEHLSWDWQVTTRVVLGSVHLYVTKQHFYSQIIFRFFYMQCLLSSSHEFKYAIANCSLIYQCNL